MAEFDWIPRATETDSIGSAVLLWLKGWYKDLYVEGDLTDGTNTVTMAEIKTAVDSSGAGGAVLKTGFPNRTDSALAMDGADLTIAPVGASFQIYHDGAATTISTTDAVTVAAARTLYFVYYEAGTLTISATAWDVEADTAPVATVFSNGSEYAIGEERHGAKRNQAWHAWAHSTIGARYNGGLAGTFGDSTFSIATGATKDEDIDNTLSAPATACRLWYRYTGGAAMTFETNVTTPYKAAAGVIQYDNAGTLTNVTANRYVCQYVYHTNDIDYPIYIIVGQAQHTTLASARGESLPSLPGLGTREWKLLYRVIYQNAVGTPTYIEAADYREVSTGPASDYNPTAHNLLSGRDATDAHPQSAITDLVADLNTIRASLLAAPTENLDITTGATTPSLSYAAGYLYVDADVEIQVPTTTGMANNTTWVYKLTIEVDGSARTITAAAGWGLDADDSAGLTIVGDASSKSVLELMIHKDNSGNVTTAAGISWSDIA